VRIETERLVLRVPRPDDVDRLVEIYSNPDVTRYITGRTREEVVEFVERVRRSHETDGFGLLIAERKEDGRVIGRAGLLVWDSRTWVASSLAEAGEHAEVEVGWVFARDCWGHGYATEAGAACRDYAFDALGRERVIAVIHPENAASIAVARRLGLSDAGEILFRGVEPVRLYALARAAARGPHARASR
jgi:RimJ/RimL family protein N-acetyltransferase